MSVFPGRTADSVLGSWVGDSSCWVSWVRPDLKDGRLFCRELDGEELCWVSWARIDWTDGGMFQQISCSPDEVR
jgi:hypothetical protein